MEKAIVLYIQSIRTPFFDHVSYIVSDQVALFFFWLALFGSLALARRLQTPMTFFALLTSYYLYYVGNDLILKQVFFRPRPYLVLESLNVIGPQSTNSSFPSDHVTAAVMLAFILVYCQRRFLIPAIVIVVLMAVSRMYNGLHWPTDTLAGVVFGTLYGLAALKLTFIFFRVKKPLFPRPEEIARYDAEAMDLRQITKPPDETPAAE